MVQNQAVRCLAIQEICEEVARYVHCGGADELLAFVLTCKIAYKASIDVLWESHDNLNVFMRLFPTDVWSENPDEPEIVNLRRAPKRQEWDRVLHYGAKLKRLFLDEGTDEALLRQLAISRPTFHVFPNLQSLEWYSHDLRSFSYVHLFLSPNLREFWASPAISHLLAKESVCEAIQENCPALHTLRITGNERLLEGIPALQSLARALPRLRNLWCPGATLEHKSLAWLSQLPDLSILAFAFPEDGDGAESSFEICSLPKGFPCLTEIGVNVASSLEQVLSFLQTVNGSKLFSLDINVRQVHPPQDGILAFCEGLATKTTLTHIALNLHSTTAADLSTITLDVILPLLELSSLKYLTLNSSYIELQGRDIRQMASRWPQLYHLELSPNTYHNGSGVNRELIGIRDIAFLAQTCEFLAWLGLHFDGSLPVPDRVKWPARPSLRTLHVYASNVQDDLRHAIRLALVLSNLFPNAYALCFDRAEEATRTYSQDQSVQRGWLRSVAMRQARWKDVAMFVEEIRASRVQEIGPDDPDVIEV